MQRTLDINALGLDGSPYTVLGGSHAPSFPDARITEDGLAAQRARSGKRYESDYEDAPWEVSILIAPFTRAALDALYTEFRSGSDLVIGSDELYAITGSQTVRGRIVKCEQVYYEEFDGCTSAIVTFAGTRRPGWRGLTTHFSLTVSGGVGTVAMPSFGGQLAAEMELGAFCASASKLIAVGIAHEPTAAYDPIDGGSWGSDVTLTSSYAALATGAAIPVADNRGSHLLVGIARHTSTDNTTLSYRAEGSVVATTRPLAPVLSTVDSSGSAVVEGVHLGTLMVPVAALASKSTANDVWGAGKVLMSQTAAGGTVTLPLSGSSYAMYSAGYSETITVAGRTLPRYITLKDSVVKTGRGIYGSVQVFSGSTLVASVSSVPVTGTTPTTRTVDIGWVPVEPGTYTLVVTVLSSDVFTLYANRNTDAASYAGGAGSHFNASGVDTAGDGTDTSIDWYFSLWGYEALSFDHTTTLRAKCTQSSKTCALHSITRIPGDWGAFIATGTFAAGKGVSYDPESRGFFPADTSGAIGSQLIPAATAGVEFGPLPGANTFVVACDGLNDVTLVGSATELRLTIG